MASWEKLQKPDLTMPHGAHLTIIAKNSQFNILREKTHEKFTICLE